MDDYGYGYSFEVDNVTCEETVMCQGHPRIEYFSNPDVTFCGKPTGVPLNVKNPSFNAKVMNESAQLVAQFREKRVK